MVPGYGDLVSALLICIGGQVACNTFFKRTAGDRSISGHIEATYTVCHRLKADGTAITGGPTVLKGTILNGDGRIRAVKHSHTAANTMSHIVFEGAVGDLDHTVIETASTFC